MRKAKHRNAMIKAEVRHWSKPEELDSALHEALAPGKQSLEERFDDIATILAAFLREKGCPHPIEFHMFSGAYWCSLPDGWDRMSDEEMRLETKNATVGRGVAYIKQNFKLTDPEAIAADICLRIISYPSLSATQKPEAAFHIGRLSQLLSSLRHLKMVEYGKTDKQKKHWAGINSSKKIREEREIEQSLSLMKDYIEEKGLTVNNAAKHAAREKNIPPSTMRSRWYATKKKNRQKKPV